GSPAQRPNGRDVVTGKHKYPSDVARPNMLYGKVLRPSAYGAKLTSIDTDVLKDARDVAVVRDGDFIGVCAPTKFQAAEAIKLLGDSAKWETPQHTTSDRLFDYLE